MKSPHTQTSPSVANERPCLLIIAPNNSYRIAPYLKAASALNLDTLIVSDSHHSLVTEVAAGLHVDFNDAQAAAQKIYKTTRRLNVAGIIATDDFTVEITAHVASLLHLPHNSIEGMKTSRWKHHARRVLQQAGLPVPTHRIINLNDNLEQQINGFPFPCVVKPVNLSASRGVIRANNRREFLNACERIRRIVADQPSLEAQQTVLVESYIPGIEVAVEGILEKGTFTALAVFDKPDPLEGPYFEETYYITPSRLPPDQQQKLLCCVADACKAYGLVTGPVHGELRINNEAIYIIEIAARTIGGECARLLEYGTGYSLEKLVIANAIGKPIISQTFQKSAGVLMIPTPKAGVLRRIEGILAAKKIPYIDAINITIREGHELKCLPEGVGYLGFIFASGPNPAAVEKALRQAHQTLNIVVAPLWTIK
ncbi:MAG: ATP-grasp domain-containing protein [Gammaproteobacteria bacterium]|nr:ATP-grasp domain-containing protein [Gammaproteobacteria bacterium]